MAQQKKGTELDVLFPTQEVDLGNGQTVIVRPLTLEDLPKVIDAFGKIMQLADEKKPPADMAMAGMGELLQILPLCIDRKPSEIPSTILPDLIEVLIEQNLTEAVVGKWTTLIQKVSEKMPDLNLPEALGQSPKKEPSQS